MKIFFSSLGRFVKRFWFALAAFSVTAAVVVPVAVNYSRPVFAEETILIDRTTTPSYNAHIEEGSGLEVFGRTSFSLTSGSGDVYYRPPAPSFRKFFARSVSLFLDSKYELPVLYETSYSPLMGPNEGDLVLPWAAYLYRPNIKNLPTYIVLVSVVIHARN